MEIKISEKSLKEINETYKEMIKIHKKKIALLEESIEQNKNRIIEKDYEL